MPAVLEDTTETELAQMAGDRGISRPDRPRQSRKRVAKVVVTLLVLVLFFAIALRPPSVMSTAGLKSTTGALVAGSVDERDDGHIRTQASSTDGPTVPTSEEGHVSSTPVPAGSSLQSLSKAILVPTRSICVHPTPTTLHSDTVTAIPLEPTSRPHNTVHPACPPAPPTTTSEKNVGNPKTSPAAATNSDLLDRSPEWVRQKYVLYASQCGAKQGMMWSKLKRTSHDAILRRVLSLVVQQASLDAVSVGSGDASFIRDLPHRDLQKGLQDLTSKTSGQSALRVLDWGCGCGVGVDAISRVLAKEPHQLNTSHPLSGPFLVTPEILGIDLTASAIDYARSALLGDSSPLLPSVAFCQADGSSLDWIPDNSYDLVVAFGSLLHLPVELMCRAVSELVRVVRVGGVVWGGYIDSQDTIARLARCNVIAPCTGSDGRTFDVTVTALKENVWFRQLGVPSANKKRRPASLVWRKTPPSPPPLSPV